MAEMEEDSEGDDGDGGDYSGDGDNDEFGGG